MCGGTSSYKFPQKVLANSFAHAVYNGRTNHEICIHPGMITIYSPGEYASNHKPEDYMKGNYESVIRNATIAKILYLNKSIEQFGSRILREARLRKRFLKRSGLYREHWTRYGIKVISSASVPNKIRNGRC